MPSAKAKAVADACREKLARGMGETFASATERLHDANPVDTTHSSNNWIGSIGTRIIGEFGSRQAPNDTMYQMGLRQLRAYNGEDLKARKKLFIGNNVFYVRFLDAGSSPQAAAGWVARALRGIGQNATHAVPRGKKRMVRKMLAKLERTAYKRSRGLP